MRNFFSSIFASILLSSVVWAGPVEPLRALAEKRNFLIGGAIRQYPKTLADPLYLDTFRKEFNVIVPEHAMKFEATEPRPGFFTFEKGDFVTDFARKNNMKVRGHTLAWHEANPAWIKNIKDPALLREALHEHIAEVVGHFKGKVLSWDVINEAFQNDGLISNEGPWPKIDKERNAGDYIREAFTWAHAADPRALLFYNDYSAEEINAKSNGIYQTLKQMKAEGVPIQGIGFQVHINANEFISENSLLANFKRFGGLGLIIHVTEMDVGIPSARPSSKWLDLQAKQFAKVFRVCLATPQCQAFLTWGLTDKYNWIEESSDNTAPLLFDKFYNPKPAYTAIRSLLQQ